jgi:hypothetical protein
MALVLVLAACTNAGDRAAARVRVAEEQIGRATEEMRLAGVALRAYADAPAGAKAGGESGAAVQDHLRRSRLYLQGADTEFGLAAGEDLPLWYRDYLAARRRAVTVRMRGLEEAEAAFREGQPLWLALDYVEIGSASIHALRQDIDGIVKLLQENQPVVARDRITATRRDIAAQRARYRTAFEQSRLTLFARLAGRLDDLDQTLALLARTTDALAADDTETMRELLRRVQDYADTLEMPVEAIDQAEIDAWFERHVRARLVRAEEETRAAEALEQVARSLVAQKP